MNPRTLRPISFVAAAVLCAGSIALVGCDQQSESMSTPPSSTMRQSNRMDHVTNTMNRVTNSVPPVDGMVSNTPAKP
jgi:hypothetical protein